MDRRDRIRMIAYDPEKYWWFFDYLAKTPKKDGTMRSTPEILKLTISAMDLHIFGDQERNPAKWEAYQRQKRRK